MPIYEYECDRCQESHDIYKPMAQSGEPEKCPVCSVVMRKKLSSVAIVGTRDSFGIGKEFVDEKTGKVVDNWRTHEKLGYRDALEFHSGADNNIKEGIKSKIKRIKNKGTEKMKTVLA